ncbi:MULTISPECIES: hypothetical protein [unclassified Holdemania]|uniref:hypothetical protein n=1 Tax=unclassified Holdemania TaxID=2637685 RepID=UPI00093433A4|nr:MULTISPECIES: hypothetical protein [unclassified Holdemania]
MKLMKRATALFLCFLMLTNGPISAFATEGTDDVVVETTTTTETVETCEECGGSDAHTETCSFNIVAPLTTEAPDETTEPTTTPTVVTEPTVTTGSAISTDPVGCTECNQTEGHLDTCSQYVAPTEETTEPTVSGNDVVGCTECGATEGHLETCSQYEAPVEDIAETDGPQVGDKIWIRSGSKVYKNHNDVDKNYYVLKGNYQVEIKKILTNADGIAEWYEFRFIDLGIGEIALSMGGYKYVHVENTSEENPDISIPGEIESPDGTVEIAGNLPDGAAVTVDVPEDEIMFEIMDEIFPDMGEYFSWVEFFDISIESNGAKWQPGEKVTVTLDTTDIQDDEEVKVYHILDDEAAIQRAIENGSAKSYTDENENTVYYTVLSSEDDEITVNDDGTISFETDSFSIFIVNGYNDLSRKELLSPNSTITMKRGDVQYFKWEPTAGTTNTGRGTWTVEAGDEYVDFEVYNSNLSADGSTGDTTNFYQYYWLKLTAKEPSGAETATIQFEYATTGDDGDGDGYIRQQEYFYVQVIETDDALYVDDQVAENGCLVPTFTQSIDTEGLTYEWTRDDGETVNPVALEAPYAISDGAVNIAMDRGGIDAEDANTDSPMKTYTVTVKNGDNVIATAEYTVPYGNELLNGGFEYPKSVYVTHDYPNGAPGLYWKTTSESVRDNEICQDIEILNVSVDTKTAIEGTYGISKLIPGITFDGTRKFTYDDVEPDYNFPDGVQCAEINCDAPGALYQDILTYPGTSMYWSLSHRGRNYAGSSAAGGGTWLPDGFSYTVNGTTLTDQKDYMYVIAAPTDQVEHIKTQEQLNELIRAAGYPVDDFTNQRPTTQYSFDANGKEVTYNGISYKIWEVATDHTAWKQYASSSAYEVGEGEYLTRFFFAAGSTSHDRYRNVKGEGVNYSGGNFIDKVSFSDEMPWQIEYYKDGVLQSTLTESGRVDLNRDTMRYPLNKTASYNNTNCTALNGTTLVKTEINGRPYTGTTLSEVYTNHNILRLYFESYGVTVTKKVEISNYEDLSENDKDYLATMLENYTVEFGLFEADSTTPVATAKVTIDTQTFVGSATFVDSNNQKFLPDKDKSYVIKETSLPTITDLELTSKAPDSETLSGNLVYAYTATNIYELNVYGDLTITKEGADPKDENQSFLFRVTGPDSFSMDIVIVGNGSTTIKHLPVGDYTVQELTDWSWRYDEVTSDPANGTVSLTFQNKQGTVTFTNTRTDRFWLSGDSYCENWWGNNGNVIRKDEDE